MNKKVLIILSFVLSFALLAGLCIFLFAYVFVSDTLEIEKNSERFLKCLDKRDWTGATRLTSSEFQESVSPGKFRHIFGSIYDQLGSYKSKSIIKIAVSGGPGIKQANAQYNAVFSKGPAIVTIVFIKKSSGWFIYSAHFNSPILKPIDTD